MEQLNIREEMSRDELKKMCKELGLKKYSSLKVCDLKDLINGNGNKKEDATSPPTNERIKLKPLVKWSGGKGDEIKLFEKYFPKDFNTYIEPFVGGGAVYFY